MKYISLLSAVFIAIATAQECHNGDCWDEYRIRQHANLTPRPEPLRWTLDYAGEWAPVYVEPHAWRSPALEQLEGSLGVAGQYVNHARQDRAMHRISKTTTPLAIRNTIHVALARPKGVRCANSAVCVHSSGRVTVTAAQFNHITDPAGRRISSSCFGTHPVDTSGSTRHPTDSDFNNLASEATLEQILSTYKPGRDIFWLIFGIG
ncbi:hypothetical protein PspLS_01718 [Pyricularia sp. CBS 133598]|nr:hypothetical protein PspLS_01718 [Pyricularia sp. CBS 133598]